MVVLPEHLHCIWTLPEGDSNYSIRWALIKSAFTRSTALGTAKARNGERTLWQRRFWEHTIRDDGDLERHIDYIHFNPVKHGHVARVRDWPYSSFHRYVRQNTLPLDWGGGVREEGGGRGFGE
jgi:REP-associated tyrosine transposase